MKLFERMFGPKEEGADQRLQVLSTERESLRRQLRDLEAWMASDDGTADDVRVHDRIAARIAEVDEEIKNATSGGEESSG